MTAVFIDIHGLDLVRLDGVKVFYLIYFPGCILHEEEWIAGRRSLSIGINRLLQTDGLDCLHPFLICIHYNRSVVGSVGCNGP